MRSIRKMVFTFGCLVQCLHNYDGRSKKQDRTFFGIYFGLDRNKKAAVVLNINTQKFTTSRSFRVSEEVFPFVNAEKLTRQIEKIKGMLSKRYRKMMRQRRVTSFVIMMTG